MVVDREGVSSAQHSMDLSTPITILIYSQPESGKSTLARNIMSNINYDDFMLVTLNPRAWEAYTEQENIHTEYIIADVDAFIAQDGIKLLVLDDICGVGLSVKQMNSVKRAVTQTQWNNTYIIVILHMLGEAGLKVVRMSSRLTFLGIIDSDSEKLIKARTRLPTKKIDEITLDPYQFLLINKQNKLSKVTARPVNKRS